MNAWDVFGIMLAVYFFIVFVALRIVVPFTGFKGLKKPSVIPAEIEEKILELKRNHPTPEAYARAAYELVTHRWHAGRISTLFYASLAWRTDLLQIWHEPGYAHCNTQNYVLYVLLLGSGFFKQTDIRLKTVFFNFFIHQYLVVDISGKETALDPAGASIHGQPFGSHIALFG